MLSKTFWIACGPQYNKIWSISKYKLKTEIQLQVSPEIRLYNIINKVLFWNLILNLLEALGWLCSAVLKIMHVIRPVDFRSRQPFKQHVKNQFDYVANFHLEMFTHTLHVNSIRGIHWKIVDNATQRARQRIKSPGCRCVPMVEVSANTL